MTNDGKAALEQELSTLGKRERDLEDALQELRLRSRQAGLAGQHDLADQAWTLFEKFRRELTELQLRIRSLEAIIYSARGRIKK